MILGTFLLFLCSFPLKSYSCFSTNSAAAPVLTDTTTTPATTTTSSTTSAAVLACATCGEIDQLMNTGIGTDRPVAQIITIGADGCATIALTCTADVATAQTVLTFYEAGVDVGTLEGTGNVPATLTCNAAGELTYTTALGTGVVDQVECTFI